MKPIVIDVEIYRCSVVFLCETTAEEWCAWYEKHKKQISLSDNFAVLSEYQKGTPGFCVHTDGNDYICLVGDRSNAGHVAHELFHAADMILHDRGYQFDGIDEPCAYLVEYLTNNFYKL